MDKKKFAEHLFGRRNPRAKLFLFLLDSESLPGHLLNVSSYANRLSMSHVATRKVLADFEQLGLVNGYWTGIAHVFIPVHDHPLLLAVNDYCSEGGDVISQ